MSQSKKPVRESSSVGPAASGVITEMAPHAEPRTVEMDRLQPFVEAEVAPIVPDDAEAPGTPRERPMPKADEIYPEPPPAPAPEP